MIIESKMKNLTKEQLSKVTDLKESLVLDQELQQYIDKCDKILAKEKKLAKEEKSKEEAMGNVDGNAFSGSTVFTPGAPTPAPAPIVTQVKKAPTAVVQGVMNPNLMSMLKQLKQKSQLGQDISGDIQSLLQNID